MNTKENDQEKSKNVSQEESSNGIGFYQSELSKHYYKSRRQLALYSGILLAWELIGLTIPNKPLTNSNIEIKSPEAFPFVLLVMISYFVYRTLIGWYLSSPQVRKLYISRFDLNSSFLIAFISVFIYIYQTISKEQLFNIDLSTGVSIILIIIVIFISFFQLIPIYVFVVDILYHQGLKDNRTKKQKVFMLLLGSLPTLILIIYSFIAKGFTLLWVNFGVLFILLIFSLLIEGSVRSPRKN